ncbi:MAG: methyltransferase domain-containing protein [Chloroflexi bacterium]|nr:methyltransferase domain-containing protein [Chloroflexota bacterium]
MHKKNEPKAPDILPVPRTKEEAKRSYDRLSRYYDYLTWVYERKYTETALGRLAVSEGETVLEIGFGTGHCLKRIAESVGPKGTAYGIDISTGMMEISKERLEKAGLENRVKLFCGDAANLPFDESMFDAVFMSFTLELFDTPEIPKVLEQIKRALKPEGRLVVVSMSKENGKSIFLRFYEWFHNKWPKYVDCRPIYVERSLREAGYTVKSKERVKLFRLPGEIVVAVNPISGKMV